jgi:hypothetical protein
MDGNGGFWVSFAWAWWIQERRTKGVNAQSNTGLRRPDAQWEEWFTV